MKVLLIGSGGREHALARALFRSPRLSRLYAAPGNPGIGALANLVALDTSDHRAVVAFCKAEDIGFVVVGPEGPLVAGLVDDLTSAGIPAFGPSKAGAQLEGSKGFTKDLCAQNYIPTAAYARFDQLAPAIAYIEAQGAPIVIKADGLAAGKGVVVAQTVAEALRALEAVFAASGAAQVVIEAVLEGEEVSFFALCDGKRALAFGSAQDHKRVGEGDTGANTGGMGAYSPAPLMSEALTNQVMTTIINPALAAMQARGMPFRGMLFAGLMIGDNGPHLIEFNTRFGDPETQVILPRLQEDLLTLLLASAEGNLPDAAIRLSEEYALCVVIAARGYPDAPQHGGVIAGVEAAAALPGVCVTQAGTEMVNQKLIAHGGRVLNVTATGTTLAQARARAYKAVDAISYGDGFHRRDIGWRALER